LLDLHDADALATEGDELAGQGRDDDASQKYRAAAELAPDNDELLFWSGLAQMKSGEIEAGAEVVKRVMAANDGWRQLLLRLDEELAPGVDDARRELGL
jgi:Flp pilus assembly protein TadD